MKQRIASFEAADFVIWLSSGALAAVLGIGLALGLWAKAAGTANGRLLADAALLALAAGVGLLAVVLERSATRVFLAALAVALVAGCIAAPHILGPR